ncbi:NAD(P)-binding domain-containing protein [Cellulomonas aerilata]|uniref:Flavoprotein n=1 Tax=Cellulomonas aerilata TaxID=515326 RepID=A0A512D8F6_9CELL|nr:NAD(P)-binding domain-containing protein [Cellulomonas aerilata]GEO32560.1 flavoprotein [Cellulomonas aerilata]
MARSTTSTASTVATAPAAVAGAGTPAPLPVAVIGAGPIGLAAAAHLADRGLPFVVLEAGTAVGAAVRQWAHVRTFTPWRYVVDPTAAVLLAPTGWSVPSTPVPPTGAEIVRHYLEPLAGLLGDRVLLGHRVVAVARDGMDKSRSVGRERRPFVLRVQDGAGVVREVRARAVVDASGTWDHPNPLGASGLPATGEADVADLLTGPLPDVLGTDRARFAGRTTLVVGAGHSAASTLLALGRLAEEAAGTRILWAIRAADPGRVYGGGAGDELPARGRLGTDLRGLVGSGVVELVTGFATTELVRQGDTVTVVGTTDAGPVRLAGVHQVVAATGFRPDLTVLAELRLDLDPGLEAPRTLGPLIDPAFHSCGTVPPHGHRDLAHPEPGFYVVGMKSYGRAPTFLLTTGNEQVRSVVAALAGDLAAADDVRLVLPQTGVCSVDASGRDTAASGGCCGAPSGVDTPAVPVGAHRLLPVGVPARGFASGLPGGGRVAELVLDVAARTPGPADDRAGCCAP